MKVKSESEVAQSCPTLSDPMDCSPPGSSIHGIFQARVLEWGAIAFSGRIYLQGSNGETDIENRLMDMGRGEERMRCMERVIWKLTLLYVI